MEAECARAREFTFELLAVPSGLYYLRNSPGTGQLAFATYA